MSKRKIISDSAAENVARNFLAKRPTGIMALQNCPHMLQVIATKMAELDGRKSETEHLSSIYDYVLEFSEKRESDAIVYEHIRFGKRYYDDVALFKLISLIPDEECGECFTERFLDLLNEQLQHSEAIIPEKELIMALRHIIGRKCEKCLMKAKEPMFISLWAINFREEQLNEIYPLNDIQAVYQLDLGNVH
jgi:hypothetical protein